MSLFQQANSNYGGAITYKQRLWLRSRAGRGVEDVQTINGQMYVEMADGMGGTTLVPVPLDVVIDCYLTETGYVHCPLS